jgi:glycosyltransferase involved in cell wall biosynthesis
VEDGTNGLWAATPEEWEEKLSFLIEAPVLREKMGREGRRRVMERFSIQSCGPRLFSIFDRLVRQKRGS